MKFSDARKYEFPGKADLAIWIPVSELYAEVMSGK